MKHFKSSLFKIIITGLFLTFISRNAYSQGCTCTAPDSTYSGVINHDITVPNGKVYYIDATGIINGNVSIIQNGKLCNSGVIYGNIDIYPSTAIFCNEGIVDTKLLNMQSSSHLYNYGKILVNDTLTLTSSVEFHNYCDLEVSGYFHIFSVTSPTVTSHGLIKVHGDMAVTNGVPFNIEGVLLVDSMLEVGANSQVILQNGSYASCGDLYLHNTGIIQSTGGVNSQIKINGTPTADPSSGYNGNMLDIIWSGCPTPAPGVQNGTLTYCSISNFPQIPPNDSCSPNVCTPILATGATICSGSSTTITVSGSTSYSYSWSTGQTGSSITVNPTSTTTYTVTTNDICAKTSMAVVTVNPKPTVTATGGTICIGDSQIITASGANTYTWDNSLGSGNSKTVSPTTTSTYVVTGTDGNGCTNAAQAVVVVNPLPIVTAAGDIICIWDTATISAGGAVTYTWSNSAIGNPITVNPTETTTYTVTGTDANTCTNTDTAIVVVNPLPIVTSIGDTICTGSAAHISAGGALTYTWSDSQTGSAILVYPTLNTTYTVTGTDINTCTNTSELMVKIKNSSLWVPNAFTPDGNGHNDVFIIRGVDIIYVDNFELHIFNSSGKSIYVSKSIYEGWNGTNQNTGDKLPEGAYVYYIKGLNCLGEPLILKGMINLLR